MSAQLEQHPPIQAPLFHVDRREGLRGAWVRHTSNGKRPHWPLKPNPGNAVRVYRATREKPLPLKMAHSIRLKRPDGERANMSTRDKAQAMAEHIKARGLMLVTLYRGRGFELREFEAHLKHALEGHIYWIEYLDPNDECREEL
jgi:hypothetical protein